jgi:hypothetical protein
MKLITGSRTAPNFILLIVSHEVTLVVILIVSCTRLEIRWLGNYKH